MSLLSRPDVQAFGMRVAVMAGKHVPLPLPPTTVASLQDVEVIDDDAGPSGFQLTFNLERTGEKDAADFAQLRERRLEPLHRVRIIATSGLVQRVLIEGVITQLDLDPIAKRLTVTGQDLSVLMDREQRHVSHPQMTPEFIVRTILLKYAMYGIIAQIAKPRSNRVPLRNLQQHDTDRRYLEGLAQQHGFVFYLAPSDAPGTTIAYWGPPQRMAWPQPALKVDLGGLSNLSSITFTTDPTAAAKLVGAIKDPQSGQTLPINTARSLRPPLSQDELSASPWATRQHVFSGETWLEELAKAQAETDHAADAVVVARGELDTQRYGSILRAHGTVGVQGAGLRHDGDYYVKRVTHKITKGQHTQNFTLTRGGGGALKPAVVP